MNSEVPKSGKTPSEYKSDLSVRLTKIALMGLASPDTTIKVTNRTAKIHLKALKAAIQTHH